MITIKKEAPKFYTNKCCRCGSMIRYELSDLMTAGPSFEENSRPYSDVYRHMSYLRCPVCGEIIWHYIEAETRPCYDED